MMIAYHTRAGRPPQAFTLAERAAFAVATHRASGRDGDVETRGRAIEACLEAAHAPTATAQGGWTRRRSCEMRSRRMRDDDERQLDAATRFDEDHEPTRKVEPARDIPGELFEWASRKGEGANANHA